MIAAHPTRAQDGALKSFLEQLSGYVRAFHSQEKREKEERAAVGKAGIKDVFNLDKVDFFYTVSAPLTQQVWDHEETLARVVRIIRQTRPEVLTTMNPAPSPGNHGNHQEAGRLAIEAFEAAGDPSRFPEQVTREGLRPFSPLKLLVRGSAASAPNGPPEPMATAEETGLSPATRGSILLPPSRIDSIASGIPWPRIFSDPYRAISPMIRPPTMGASSTTYQWSWPPPGATSAVSTRW